MSYMSFAEYKLNGTKSNLKLGDVILLHYIHKVINSHLFPSFRFGKKYVFDPNLTFIYPRMLKHILSMSETGLKYFYQSNIGVGLFIQRFGYKNLKNLN